VIYTVQSGDTLFGVTYRLFGYRRTWQEWAEYAGIDPHRLEVGQRIPYPDRWPVRPRYPLGVRETQYYEYGDIYAPGPHGGKPHPGVDFHEREGARVYAPGEGIVVADGDDPGGYGYYTVIEHLTTQGPRWVLIAHLTIRGRWRIGDTIRAEDLCVGWEGTSGNSGNLSHVHYEVKLTDELELYSKLTPGNLDDYYISPRAWLDSPDTLIVPTSCWGCPGRECQ
jgi:murein DD-endopeptidase MepM/ murein hydrolase activator NlpD